jgi:protein SCO1/2
MPRTSPFLPPLATALCLALACAPGDSSSSDEAGPYSGLNLPYPLEKPDFTFTDVEGRAFDFRAETEGFVTLLFFGYTSCPDICPVQLANIGAVLRDLPAETASRIKVVFVTTDPERDTPERMRVWLAALHPALIGVRGPLDEVHAAEASLLLPSSVIEQPHAGADGVGGHEGATSQAEGAAVVATRVDQDYGVAHASAVVAFTADGLARVMYSSDTRQQDWRRDLPRLVADRGR